MSETLELEDMMNAPYCDAGCGDLATVMAEHVGLCDDHVQAAAQEALRETFGEICGRIYRDQNGNKYVCIERFGVEHDHN